MTMNTISEPCAANVEAERELQKRNGVLVQGVHEHVHDVAEEKSDPQMHQHQGSSPSPMRLIVGALLHGRLILPAKLAVSGHGPNGGDVLVRHPPGAAVPPGLEADLGLTLKRSLCSKD
jgi:hypothetical protein